jgi:hypothetical protein
MSAADKCRYSESLHLFADIHRPLHDPFHLLKLRAHPHTCTSKCDRVLQFPAYIRVIHEPLVDCLSAFGYSARFKLWHDIQVTIHSLVSNSRGENIPFDIKAQVSLGDPGTLAVELYPRRQTSFLISSISCYSGH